MARVRLTNLINPKKVLSMSEDAWHRIVELAEEYGWQPLGAFRPDGWLAPGDPQPGYYPDYIYYESSPPETLDDHAPDLLRWESNNREAGGRDPGDTAGIDQVMLVILEDALSMAGALEQALLEYEPEPVYKLQGTFLSQLLRLEARSRPGLGAITALVEFCRLGGFRLERY